MFDLDPRVVPMTFDEEVSTCRALWDGYMFDLNPSVCSHDL